jgi:alpha-glucoside transport system substrate-binding protein
MNKSYRVLTAFVMIAMLVTACATATTAPVTTTAPTMAPATSAPAQPTSAPPTEAMPTIDCGQAKSGDQVSVMYQWSGNEESLFNTIMKPFIDACGVQIVANSTRDAAVLDTAVKSTPPDVLFWPTTSPLNLYTSQLQDLTTLGVDPANYADYWIKMGTVDGKLLTIPAKSDIKTIIWYSPAQFAANGYTVPTTLDELQTLVDQMVANGQVPWAMGFASTGSDGWTGSDFIQDLLLAMQGPDYVNGIIDGTVPYNDPGVLAAYQLYYKWASDPKYTVGGATGTVNTNFAEALLQPFSDPPQAMMVKQSGFAGGNIAAAYPDLKYGTDYDFFMFPGAKGVQGGADNMFAFSTSAATKAMISYITGPIGAANWAKANFSIDPNVLANGKYTDPQTAKSAEILASASGFTPDIGDTIPAPFGTAEWTAIINVVQGKDIQSELDSVESVLKGIMGTIDCGQAKSGDQVSVMYQWSGNEESLFNTIMKPFIDACGVQIVANSTRDAAVLDTAVKSTPPDVLFWPTTSPLNLYTSQLQDLTTLGVDPANYADYWIKMGTVDGKLLTIPAKSDIKTIIWYSPAQFAANGYTVPTTLDELQTLVDQMVANGQVPWAMGFASTGSDGWTGSDFIQDLLLAMQGPDYVNGIIDGTVPYNDPGVLAAYQLYYKWASDPKYTVGGATGTVNTNFAEALLQPFSDPPQAMMVKQSGFAGGNIAAAYPDLKYGTDYDFFMFPGAKGVQGGADNMFAFSTSAATKAMISYITGPIGAANWAKANFSIDPNVLANGKYTDPQTAKSAEILASASGFTPDIGDTIPAPFGTAEWTAIINVVQGKDIQSELNTVEQAQMQALGK